MVWKIEYIKEKQRYQNLFRKYCKLISSRGEDILVHIVNSDEDIISTSTTSPEQTFVEIILPDTSFHFVSGGVTTTVVVPTLTDNTITLTYINP